MVHSYKRLMVPVDGSEASLRAFKKAVDIAKRNEAEMHVVMVVDNSSGDRNIDPSIMNDRGSFFESLRSYALSKEQPIKTEVRMGNPKEIIPEVLVNEWGIDLIVMGATGKGAFAKLLLGSVTNHVLRHAKCDVMVAR